MNDHVERIKSELDSINTMSLDEFNAMRNERFRKMLLHHYNNPYNSAYMEFLREHGIEGEEDLPRSVEEIGRLPMTDKEFLRKGGFAKKPCVPKEEISKNIQTTGSTDTPLFIPHSYKAGNRLYGELLVRSMIINGFDLTARHYWVMHYTKDQDNWSSHAAAQRVIQILGDKIIDESTQTPLPKHIENILKYKPKGSASSPNFYLALMNIAMSMNINLKDSSLEEILTGGSAFSDEAIRQLKENLGLNKIVQIYISTENFNIGTETPEKCGYCIHSDEQIVEVVDEDGNYVKEGQKGKILITPISMDAAPVIRFLQGDEVVYLGKKDSKFVVIDNIRRFNEASIGDGLLPYAEIESMPNYASKMGVPILAIQIAKQRREGKDLPTIRVESPVDDKELVEKVMKEIFLRNPQMRNEVESGTIHEPVLELYKPGELREGKLKVPLFRDETN